MHYEDVLLIVLRYLPGHGYIGHNHMGDNYIGRNYKVMTEEGLVHYED